MNPAERVAGQEGLVAVAVTHEASPDDKLVQTLRAGGARVVEWPAVRTVPPSDTASLEEACSKLDSYDWITFTSARAVRALGPIDSELDSRLLVAVVGEVTAQVARAHGWSVDLVSPDPGAGALGVALAARLQGKERILFPASAQASGELEAALGEKSLIIERVEAYGTEPRALDGVEISRALMTDIGALTFLSPSAVRSVMAALGSVPDHSPAAIVCIGPTTEREARGAGFEHIVVAREATRVSVAACVLNRLAATVIKG